MLNSIISYKPVYEDKVNSKIPEDVCVNLLEKYKIEQSGLSERVAELRQLLDRQSQDEHDVNEFIRRIKQYAEVEELDRAMCLELIDRIYIGARDVEVREIGIHYKLIG